MTPETELCVVAHRGEYQVGCVLRREPEVDRVPDLAARDVLEVRLDVRVGLVLRPVVECVLEHLLGLLDLHVTEQVKGLRPAVLAGRVVVAETPCQTGGHHR